MRKISKLAALSLVDQQHVLSLCENRRYDDVAPILARPRSEGGLDLKTSRSALSRFASTFHAPEPDRLKFEIKRLMPLLEASSVEPALLPQAIQTLLQQHICTQLTSDAPFETVVRPFRFLFKLHREQHAKTALLSRDLCASFHNFSGKIARNPAIPANSAKKTFFEISCHS